MLNAVTPDVPQVESLTVTDHATDPANLHLVPRVVGERRGRLARRSYAIYPDPL